MTRGVALWGRIPALARAGLVLIALLSALALGTPVLAPYDPNQQLDPASGRHRPPGTALAAVELADGRWLLAERAERTAQGLRIERLGTTRFLPASEVANLTAEGVADRRVFVLGSDAFGRDVWSRIVHGARVSLAVGLLSVVLALSLGLLVGAAAAVAGRAVDTLLMRAVDGLMAFPWLFLVLTLSALFRPTVGLVILILGGTSWMQISRLVRAEMKGIMARDFVLAARASGLRPSTIVLRHLLPNALAPALIAATLLVGDVILVEAALSFLGAGIPPPTPSWGNMIDDGREFLRSAWWVSAFPGVAIALTVIAFNLLGDGLRDALDPRRRTSGRDPGPDLAQRSG